MNAEVDFNGWKAILKNYTSVGGYGGWRKMTILIIYHGNSTLSNRLVAVSQTQVIETLSCLGDDLPGEINRVGHQHYRKYHHDNIYYDIHCDALLHYGIHNITAFHCFFTRVKTSQGGNLRTDLTATFLTVHSTVFLQGEWLRYVEERRSLRNITLPFYTFLLGRVSAGCTTTVDCWRLQDWFFQHAI